MPQVSAIAKLPIPVRRELNRRILGNGFSGYAELAEELARRGFRISKSSLHRYGQRLLKVAEKTERDGLRGRLRNVPDNELPMTVIAVVDLQSGGAQVLATPNSIEEVVALLDPLKHAGRTDETDDHQ